MRKAWAQANALIAEVKKDLPNLLTKDEKLTLLNEVEKLANESGLGIFLDAFIESAKADI